MSHHPEVADPATEPTAWERYGWAYAGLWLIFLLYPLIDSWQVDDLARRATGIGLVLAFAAIYLNGFRLMDRLEHAQQVRAMSWRHLAGMALAAGASALLINVEALGYLPFFVAFSVFGVWRTAALLVTAAAGLVVAAVAAWIRDPLPLFYLAPIALTAVATGAVRIFEEKTSGTDQIRQRAALAEERERVARDVHDLLGHSLTVVSAKAELAERVLDRDPERARAELAQIQTLTRQALTEVRSTVTGLRVARLSEELQAARSLLDDAGIEADLPDERDTAEVDPAHRTIVAWALREAVTNSRRHADARRVQVRWGSTWLEVGDDGTGPTQANGRMREGNGIRGLRERVERAGGTISIGPGDADAPRPGTRVRIDL